MAIANYSGQSVKSKNYTHKLLTINKNISERKTISTFVPK